jgi:hypothetical protein
VTLPARLAGLARRLPQLHEDPTVIARWQAWTRPVLSRMTPGRRRAVLALAALYAVGWRPLKEARSTDMLKSPDAPLAAVAVVLLCFALVIVVYLVVCRFPALPAAVRARPQLWLHGLFWTLVLLHGLAPGSSGVAALAFSGVVITLPFLLWRLGYLVMSGQRGRMSGTRFSDHLIYIYPSYGGSSTPYGKGLDYLSRHEAQSQEDLARSQLAGLKLVVLAWIWSRALDLMQGLVYAEPGGTLSAHGLGVARLGALLPAGRHPAWAAAWAAVYGELVWEVLKLAARGHGIVGILRLFGFNVFRNTYRPLLATSVVEFWNRYYYYFKELMVDFFFFPTYIRRFRRHPRLRILAATVAAAGLGNLYYHVLKNDAFLLALDWVGLLPWLGTHAFYCLALSLGIYVSMLREQRRRGAQAGPPASLATRVRRIAGVWTFYGLIAIWGADSAATFQQRVDFFLSLFGLR